MLNENLFVIMLLACLLGSGETLSYTDLKVLNFNMGGGYCRDGESYPNCDTYIKDTVNKIISMGSKYDILCLQEFPKYYRSEQKATADRLINEFALKYKYSVFRKENSEIAILSKFPIQDKGQIDLSSHYGSQRISFMAGGKKVQVVNTHNAWSGIVPNIETRKQDIRKTLRWMSLVANMGDINIFAGDFNMDYKDVESVIASERPFGSSSIPPRSCNYVDCIFAWGETGWPFVLEHMTYEDHQYAIGYTKTFGDAYSYIPNRYVTIEGTSSLLGVNGKVSGGSYQWAFFGTQAYLNSNPKYPYKFIVEQPVYGGGVRISCPFDAVSFLSLNNRLEPGNNWEWAFWGSWEYLQNSSRYVADSRYQIDPYGLTLSSIGDSGEGFLSPNNPVTNWQWAFFGTTTYINSSTRYSKTIVVKDRA